MKFKCQYVISTNNYANNNRLKVTKYQFLKKVIYEIFQYICVVGGGAFIFWLGTKRVSYYFLNDKVCIQCNDFLFK